MNYLKFHSYVVLSSYFQYIPAEGKPVVFSRKNLYPLIIRRGTVECTETSISSASYMTLF